jgi:hypothetical protein
MSTRDRLAEYARRLSPEDRAAMLSGFGCTGSELAPHEPQLRKERARKPAEAHEYRAGRISTQEGLIVRCRVRDCQDDRHRVMGMLGVIQP